MSDQTGIKLLVAGGSDFVDYRLLQDKLSQITCKMEMRDVSLLCSNEAGAATLARLWFHGSGGSVNIYRCDPLGLSFSWIDLMISEATHAVIFDGGNDPAVSYLVECVARREIPCRLIRYTPEADVGLAAISTVRETN